MKNRKGLTLIEIIIALALLGIIAISLLTAISKTYTFLLNTKGITQEVFDAQKLIEEQIEVVKSDLFNDITPSGPTAYTLFTSSYGGAFERTVTGFVREAVVSNNRKFTTIIGEIRSPEFIVPVTLSTVLTIRNGGMDIPENYDYTTKSGLSLRATSVIDEKGVFLVNRHEWYVSRDGFNIPMVGPGALDEDFDLGRLYPLFPNDYHPIPIKANSDMLSQSELNTILDTYIGHHIIYTITPYADTGKKGATTFSQPMFLTGPSVLQNLVMHLDASLISKEDMSSVESNGDSLYAKQWKDISKNNNNATQSTQSSMPALTEIMYQDYVFVWGKSLAKHAANASMSVSSFSASSMDEFTVFLVAKANVPDTDITIMERTGSNPWSIGINDDGDMFINAYKTGTPDPAILAGGLGMDGNWHVFAFTASNGDLKAWINGTSGTDGTYGTLGNTDSININWHGMEIAEILIYDRDLSTGPDMGSVEAYLIDKYNPNPSIVDVSIIMLKPINPVTLTQHQTFNMPVTVSALMSNGTTQNVAVNWSVVIDTSVVGTHTSIGTATMDASKTVELIVNVVAIDYINSLAPITVEKGQPYPLPASLPATLTNGDIWSVQVSWSGNVEELDVGQHFLVATALLDNTKTVDLQVDVVPVSVKGVNIIESSVTVIRGQTHLLTANVIPPDAANQNLIWTSSDDVIASVAAGLVTAHFPGTAIVTVTTEDGGFTDVCTVNVIPVHVTGVTLNKSATTIINGNTETLVATVVPVNADNMSVNWTSNNHSVATVSNGTVTAVGPGTANITATTVDGGYTDVCAVTVTQPVSGVTLSHSSISLNDGDTFTLIATVAPANATNKTVTWTTSNSAVATVANGLVTATGPGNATITVQTVDGGFTSTCSVSVTAVYTVTLSVSHNNRGDVRILAPYGNESWGNSATSIIPVPHGQTVQIAARTEGSGTWSNWSDGNTSPNRSIVVTGNVSLTANFGSSAPSCPFVYSFDGAKYHMEHESIPFAINKALETTSYGTLRNLKEIDGKYYVKIAEDLDEISFVNGFRLFAVDYASNSGIKEVFADIFGVPHTIQERVSPVEFTDSLGTSKLSEIKTKGILVGSDVSKFQQEEYTESYEAIFHRPTGAANTAKLMVSAQKTTLTTELGLFYLDRISATKNMWWIEKVLSLPSFKEKFSDFMSVINLRVDLWNGEEWIPQGEIKAGLHILEEFLVPLDLSIIKGEQQDIKVRLVSGAGLFEMDLMSIDFSENAVINVHEMFPETAIFNDMLDVKQIIEEFGGNERVRMTTGDWIDLTYIAPTLQEGLDRGFMVALEGYYYMDPDTYENPVIDTWEGMNTLEGIVAALYAIPDHEALQAIPSVLWLESILDAVYQKPLDEKVRVIIVENYLNYIENILVE